MFDLRTEWIPAVWHFENYPNAISRAPFVQYFINSGIVSLAVMIGNVVACTLAGYGSWQNSISAAMPGWCCF